MDIENELTKFLENNIKNGANKASEPPRDCRRLNILREYDNETTNLHS